MTSRSVTCWSSWAPVLQFNHLLHWSTKCLMIAPGNTRFWLVDTLLYWPLIGWQVTDQHGEGWSELRIVSIHDGRTGGDILIFQFYKYVVRDWCLMLRVTTETWRWLDPVMKDVRHSLINLVGVKTCKIWSTRNNDQDTNLHSDTSMTRYLFVYVFHILQLITSSSLVFISDNLHKNHV